MNLMEEQLQSINRLGIVKNVSRYKEYCQIISIDENIGHGVFELYTFDNYSMGRTNFSFKHRRESLNPIEDSEFILHFVFQGEVNYQQKDKRFRVAAPAIFLIKNISGEVTSRIEKDVQINSLHFHLKKEYVNTLIEQSNHNTNTAAFDYQKSLIWHFKQEPQSVTELPLSPATRSLLQQVWTLFIIPAPTDEISLMKLRGSSSLLLSSMLMTNYDEFYKVENDIPSYVLQTQFLLDNFYHKNWTVDEIARKVDTNQCYLKTAFKKHTGKSIHQYRLHKRMLKAQEMLAQNVPTTDIARQLGFNTHHYFQKVFKKFTKENNNLNVQHNQNNNTP